MKRLENKGFPNDSLSDLEKEVLKTPMPYCLCHKIDLETSMLERKHCMSKDCPHLVFVKEIWTASHQNEKILTIRRAMEAEIA